MFFEDTDFVLLNALLTEQSLLTSFNRLKNSTEELMSLETISEGIRIEGIKDTFKLSQLHNEASDAEIYAKYLRNDMVFDYKTTDESGNTEDKSINYFKSVALFSTECPGNQLGPVNPGNDGDPESELYRCRTIYTVTFNLNPSDEEKKNELTDKNGIDSLEEQFIKQFGGSI